MDQAKIRQRLLGPKMFTIGRLLAIFNAITDQEGIKFNEIDVLQQVNKSHFFLQTAPSLFIKKAELTCLNIKMFVHFRSER